MSMMDVATGADVVHQGVVHEHVVHEHEFHARDAPPHVSVSCMAYLQSVQFSCGSLKQFRQGMEDCKNATGETSFEAKAWDENRTGVRGRRLDFFTGGGCIRGGRADTGRAADAKLFTDSRNHAW
jgi:hypothetical protein